MCGFLPSVPCSGGPGHHGGLPAPCSVFSAHRDRRGPSALRVLGCSPGGALRPAQGSLLPFPSLGGCFDVLTLWLPVFFRQEDVSGPRYPSVAGKAVFIFDLWPYIHHLRMKFLHIIGSIPAPLSFLMPVPYSFHFWDCDNLWII